MSSMRMNKYKNSHAAIVKPIGAGVVIAIAITLIIICIISIISSIIESIAKNAIGPLSLAAMIIGCFAGAYFCSRTNGKKGIIIGAIIGVLFFLIIFIFSCFSSGISLGDTAVIKFTILLISGCCGGYLGSNGRCGRKSKR